MTPKTGANSRPGFPSGLPGRKEPANACTPAVNATLSIWLRGRFSFYSKAFFAMPMPENKNAAARHFNHLARKGCKAAQSRQYRFTG
jgi:hypothetical protein